MKDLVIIGAGDFAREAVWVAERMNLQYPQWNIWGYVDDGREAGTLVDGYPILGNLDWLRSQPGPVWAVCAIGTSRMRQRIWEKLAGCPVVHPATLVDPAVVVGKNSVIGGGCILCAGTVLTVDVKLGAHCIVNLGCMLGHDVLIGDCCTLNPRVDLSGNVRVGSCTDIGAGALVRDEVMIGGNTIIGMGSLVTKDVPAGVVAYGSPCKTVRKNKDGVVFR